MIRSLPRPVAVQLLIIRAAMLLGLVLFGVSTFYVKQRKTTAMMTDERAQLFGYIFVGMAGSALVGMIAIRSRLSATTDVKRLTPLYMVGYALAEAAALFGAVTWYIGGAREWFIAGLVLMVVAFQVLPIKRDAVLPIKRDA